MFSRSSTLWRLTVTRAVAGNPAFCSRRRPRIAFSKLPAPREASCTAAHEPSIEIWIESSRRRRAPCKSWPIVSSVIRVPFVSTP